MQLSRRRLHEIGAICVSTFAKSASIIAQYFMLASERRSDDGLRLFREKDER
ncbi:MAG: hypothetical protein LBV36_05330 [Chromatiales bacterium]|nr:hypothetical protein [Chromatiales bacterium]